MARVHKDTHPVPVNWLVSYEMSRPAGGSFANLHIALKQRIATTVAVGSPDIRPCCMYSTVESTNCSVYSQLFL
jgi:hypothetical protein